MRWDPEKYSQFADQRSAPINDLIDSVVDAAPGLIVDLGAGTGVALPLLRQRWPKAHIIAVDNSPEMLAEMPAMPGVNIVSADIADWRPSCSVDLIFSNAVLHWLDRHEILFPRLMGWLKSGGTLAVQMPNNWEETSHREMLRIATSGPWAERLAPHLRISPILEADVYREILAPLSSQTNVFEKTYLHRLEGDNPVAEWMLGSSLGQVVGRLSGLDAEEFVDLYKTAMRQAYPVSPDGRTHYAFRRIFIIARNRA